MNVVLEPPPTPSAIRDELQQAVINDLLGPAAGPDEEMFEPPRVRYFVGMLAPRRQRKEHEPPDPDTGEDVGLPPVVHDELAEGGEDSVEDGPAEQVIAPVASILPSSFGLTFCVDGAATAIKVAARWGHYARVKSEQFKTATGQPKMVWKRCQIEGTSPPIPLQPGPIRWTVAPEFGEVEIQGIVRPKHHDQWIVTLFLVNGQTEPDKLRDTAWLFQPEIIVESPDGDPIFRKRPTRRAPDRMDPIAFAEWQAMEMIYRKHVEFAVGHGVSVHADLPDGATDRANRVSTRVIPISEIPKTEPPTATEIPALRGLVLDMKELSETAMDGFAVKLGPLVKAYEGWIAEETKRIEHTAHGLAGFQEPANEAINRCKATLERIKGGLGVIGSNEQAAETFRFMNRAMWLQRTRTIYSECVRRGEKVEIATVDVPENRSWYPFQLAFILLTLPGMTDLHHDERTAGHEAVADLLWFPTGGGKTEAYLGLAAYTMGIRRLQGVVDGRSGESGVAVLMRYTLRLLTLQQFQRAAALMCACESIRREAIEREDSRWGRTPFRIGLWVGRNSTPNTTEQSAEAIKRDHGHYNRSTAVGGSGTPAQLTNCPWCGLVIDPGKDIKVESFAKGRCRTLIYCSDPLGQCLFSRKRSPDEGLPVLVVDEEIYRLLPILLIATVDKFAQMPWKGQTQMLFGQVEGFCPRHGFRSPEVKDSDSHPRKGAFPSTKTVPHNPVRPPDLIIQDELHLISGPLGTLVGLYETAVDRLATWTVDGREVHPKVIASTATIRRAPDQVRSLFLRKVNIFPPHGLDVEDNFFSRQRDPSAETPGRRYLGICAPGRRLKAALIRVYLAYLAAGQQIYEKHGQHADPWMTLVGYFNAIRELGGMRRLVDDDIRTRLGKMDQRGLARRSPPLVEELTSRKGSSDIPRVLDLLEEQFDPVKEMKRKEMLKQGRRQNAPRRPLDVLLATNMVSVGVDVKRLGLMVVAGQPKTTAEYIQATSRVGRSKPGIVCTVFNWARPRDLSHYEQFEHYHATFYKHVEALSVTPFASRAIDRGLTALLISLVRLVGAEFNHNKKARHVDRNHPYFKDAIDAIATRAGAITCKSAVQEAVRQALTERLDEWLAEAQNTRGGRELAYRDERDGVTVPLLHPAGLRSWDHFTCLNSLRDVEPTVGLILMEGVGLDEDAETTTAEPDGQPEAEVTN